MLKIENLDGFRAHVQHKPEIREMDIGEGCVSFCYMIAEPDTFDSPWARECRGIVFDKTSGLVVGRPLHKFFNVNERPETQLNALDWSDVFRSMDKRDGSMIHTVNTRNGLRLKSKKTFESQVAKDAEEWLNSAHGYNTKTLCEYLILMNKTVIFEWTAPDARIVLYYEKPELQLLHVRDNLTGTYASRNELSFIKNTFLVNMVDEAGEIGDSSINYAHALIEQAKTAEDREGWVIQFNTGEMVKLKTAWYLERHRLMTFLRERDIAEAALNETLDDQKSLLAAEGVNLDEIVKIEKRVVHELNHIREHVEAIVGADRHLDRKSFALRHTGGPYFGLLMSQFLGQEPKYKEYFEKHVLKQEFSLRQLNLVPSVAEAD